MFKYLPPENGLWHVGEQCGLDLYMDVDSDQYFYVDMIKYPEYNYGIFQGKSIEFATNWIENQDKIKDNKDV
jgi:hypothetical protein